MPVEWRRCGDPPVCLDGFAPSPHPGVGISAHPIEHRVRTDQRFGPLSEFSGFIWSSLNRRETGAQDEGSRLQKRRPGFAGQTQSTLDAGLGQVHVLLICVQQCQGLH